MIVETKGLEFGYRDTRVLHHIDLLMDEPGLICIVGPNGVGKSTLVKCILKLLSPDGGTVCIDRIDTEGVSQKELARVMGYVPVGSESAFAFTVFDTVMMGRYPHQKAGISNSELDWEIVMRALNMMEVADLSMKNTNELSAGQFQRVAIAKGLAQTPRVLFLDEPTANLDPRHQLQVTERLSEISKEVGMTVVMISHDLNISAKYADKVIMMSLPGQIHSIGTPQEVFTEDAIREVYGVECQVINHNSRPHIILERPLSDSEMVAHGFGVSYKG